MSPFHQHLVTMGCHKNLGTGIFFPSLLLLYLHFFFSSILLPLKFLPMIKSQQEVKSQGFPISWHSVIHSFSWSSYELHPGCSFVGIRYAKWNRELEAKFYLDIWRENIFPLDLWGNVTQTLSLFSLAFTSYLWLHTIITIIIIYYRVPMAGASR